MPLQVDVNLVHKLLKVVHEGQPEGAVLVFVPGWSQITRIQELILGCATLSGKNKTLVVPLHSQVHPPCDTYVIYVI